MDVTECKRAEEARAYLAAIIASSGDAIVGKTLDSVITSWNEAAERMFGYTAAEAVGQQIYLIIPPERHGEEGQILERLRRGERIEHFETVRRRKDGTHIDVSLTVSLIKDSEGRIIGASKIARDITERKRAEQRLAAQYAVTRVLAETTTLHEAIPSMLQAICDTWDGHGPLLARRPTGQGAALRGGLASAGGRGLRVRWREPRVHLYCGRRPARPRLGQRRARLDCRRHPG